MAVLLSLPVSSVLATSGDAVSMLAFDRFVGGGLKNASSVRGRFDILLSGRKTTCGSEFEVDVDDFILVKARRVNAKRTPSTWLMPSISN